MAYRTHKANHRLYWIVRCFMRIAFPLSAREIEQSCMFLNSGTRTIQRDLQHLQTLHVARRTGNATKAKWSFTDVARDYFQEMKALTNREYYDLHGRPGNPAQPIWRLRPWAHWMHAGSRERLHPIMEEMIRRMITGTWAEELDRMEESREAVIDRLMGRARDALREPKDNGKFG